MKKQDIVKAWKNAEYRASLSAAEREMLPEHPCGLVSLHEEDLSDIAGGSHYCPVTHEGTCVTVWIGSVCCDLP